MAITVDAVVRMAIEDLFPDQTIPDEENYLPNGQQHKAPDHAILGGTVLIERKSRNGSNETKIVEWLNKVSILQATSVYGYGTQSVQHLLDYLPDVGQANAEMTDLYLRQSLKNITEARKKYEDHARYIDDTPRLRIVVLSDNTDILSTNDYEEAYFGRKMGGYATDDDITGMIDALVLVRHPRHTVDGANSYWFKCLIKIRVTGVQYDTLRRVIDALHFRIGNYGEYASAIHPEMVGGYAPLIV